MFVWQAQLDHHSCFFTLQKLSQQPWFSHWAGFLKTYQTSSKNEVVEYNSSGLIWRQLNVRTFLCKLLSWNHSSCREKQELKLETTVTTGSVAASSFKTKINWLRTALLKVKWAELNAYRWIQVTERTWWEKQTIFKAACWST